MVASDEMVRAEVLAAANGFCAAVTADNESAVESFLADELFYRHSNGLHDLKTSYLAKLSSRKREMWLEDPDVRVYGDFALIVCDYVIDGKDPDGSNPTHAEYRGLQAWTRRDGRWQLLAHQGTYAPKKD